MTNIVETPSCSTVDRGTAFPNGCRVTKLLKLLLSELSVDWRCMRTNSSRGPPISNHKLRGHCFQAELSTRAPDLNFLPAEETHWSNAAAYNTNLENLSISTSRSLLPGRIEHPGPDHEMTLISARLSHRIDRLAN